MSISAPFIHRPVATTLLTVAVAFAGALAYTLLPVSPLPQVDFPTIQVSASLPGASPEMMASSVATPLERQFGRIAGVNEMTSSSNLRLDKHCLQFDLSRDIDAAARDVQAAINAARGQLPANLPNNPTLSKGQPGRCAGADPGAHVRHDRQSDGFTMRLRPFCSRNFRRLKVSAKWSWEAVLCRQFASM